MAEPKVWTVEDTRRMLRGPEGSPLREGGAVPPLSLPGAVSAAIETAQEQPPQTESIKPVGRDRNRR